MVTRRNQEQIDADADPAPPPLHESTLTAVYDIYGFTLAQVERADDLADWLLERFTVAISTIIPKAIAYGSADLELMGKAMSQFRPEPDGTVNGQELAVWFYALGKVARLEGAYAQGQEPDVDSWYDLFVYSLMAMHIREKGGW